MITDTLPPKLAEILDADEKLLWNARPRSGFFAGDTLDLARGFIGLILIIGIPMLLVQLAMASSGSDLQERGGPIAQAAARILAIFVMGLFCYVFEQSVLNIINNALAHGGSELRQINLTTRHVNGRLEVSVSDDGKGIAPENYERALGRFSQIGPNAGSGLGLPIAAAVAEAFGGGIALMQKDQRFTVTLSFPGSTAERR